LVSNYCVDFDGYGDAEDSNEEIDEYEEEKGDHKETEGSAEEEGSVSGAAKNDSSRIRLGLRGRPRRRPARI
jgi:hypothetical protein